MIVPEGFYPGGNAMAISMMLFSVLVWSLFPLIGALGIDDLGIFDFIAWIFVINFATAWLMMKLIPSVRHVKLPKWRALGRKTWGEILIGCLTMNISLACLLTAFSYMSKAGATIIYEVWPIVAMYMTPLLIRNKGWDKISGRDLFFSVLAFIGIGFIIHPEIEAQGGFFLQEDWKLNALILSLPFLGGVFMSVSSVMKARISHNLEVPGNPLASVLFVKMTFSLVIALSTIPFILFWPDQTSVFTTQSILVLLFAGVAIYTLGDVAYTLAVLGSSKSNIVVLWFLVPIFSVIWLWLAGESAITPWIILGSLMIISSNLLMTVKADNSTAYVTAVVSMIGAGIYCFFVDGMGMDDYYEAVGVPLVFFAILVAFIMDRLIKRDTLEEELAVEMVNHIDANPESFKPKGREYCEHILSIVRTRDPDKINSHYKAVRNSKNRHMKEIWTSLDRLALSKIQGTTFAEFFILFVVGGLTVAVSVLYRPNDMVGDSFAIVQTVAVVFIFFTVLDLAKARQTFHLHRNEKNELHLAEEACKNQMSERIISSVLIMMMLAAFLFLLALKHGLAG